MPKMLVFGSLRKNSSRGYNYDRFGEGSQKYIKDVELDGFEMYDLGAYPTIVEGIGKIKTELHEVTDYAFTRIKSMEAGAGYSEKTITLNDETATIFYMPKEQLSHYNAPKVESGDWN